MDIGVSINIGCSKAKMTNQELAKSSGVGVVSISNWITGKTSPSLKNVEAMAKSLNVSVSEFIKWGE